MDPSLIHYGIPGMHWGRRTIRGVNVSGTTNVRGRLTSKNIRGKPIHSPEAIKKMTNEVMSKSLSMKIKNMDPQKVATGKKIVGGILKAGLGVAILANLPKIMWAANKVLINLTPS